jgi:hypothetical protein
MAKKVIAKDEVEGTKTPANIGAALTSMEAKKKTPRPRASQSVRLTIDEVVAGIQAQRLTLVDKSRFTSYARAIFNAHRK